MEYSNADLSVGQTDLSYVEYRICISVYNEIVKEMAEVIKDAPVQIFLLPFYPGDVSAVSRRTKYFSQKSGICIRRRSEVKQVPLEWSPYSEWKKKLDRYIRCRNYDFAGIPKGCWTEFKSVVIVVRNMFRRNMCTALLPLESGYKFQDFTYIENTISANEDLYGL